MKFVFSGFYSVIEIGENVQFQETIFHIYNNTRMEIGENVQFQKTVLSIHNKSKLKIEENVRIVDSQIHLQNLSEVIFGKETQLKNSSISVEDMAKLDLKKERNINSILISIKRYAQVLLEENVLVFSNNNRKTNWNIEERAKFKVGKNGRFSVQAGECYVGENALLKIGTGFSINGNYRIVVNQGTSILMGDDCMFSYDISMRSNDGHSIFDVESKENVNSTEDVYKNRGIILGKHIWIGERVCILYNTQIGDGSIIGAMSLVKSRIPNNCIVAGIPAKVIKRNVAWSRKEGADDIIECGPEYINLTKEL